MSFRGYVWSDEQIAELKRLWADGVSATDIAHAIGLKSKNVVLGKIHRLGLSGRATELHAPGSRKTRKKPSSSNRSAGEKKKRVLTHTPKIEIEMSVPVASPLLPTLQDGVRLGVPFLALSVDDCKWPTTPDNHPRGASILFCGELRMRGKPYCHQHWLRSMPGGHQRLEADRKV